MGEDFHKPVMVSRVLDLIGNLGEGLFLDATVGGGGHTVAVLERWPSAKVVGIDKDPWALEEAIGSLEGYGERVSLVQSPFSQMAEVMERLGFDGAHAILMDLGVSSRQLEDPARGFTYWGDVLDMRMDPQDALRASDIVNTWDERDIASILSRYGEEKWASRIARFVVSRRPILSAAQLVEAVKDAIPAKFRRTGPHPARRTFQALRMTVNREMEELEMGLAAAVRTCLPGGRLVVISYHSLEDRLVKHAFRQESEHGVLRIITRRAERPAPDEVQQNPRSRSAKLRAAERSQGIGASGREYR